MTRAFVAGFGMCVAAFSAFAATDSFLSDLRSCESQVDGGRLKLCLEDLYSRSENETPEAHESFQESLAALRSRWPTDPALAYLEGQEAHRSRAWQRAESSFASAADLWAAQGDRVEESRARRRRACDLLYLRRTAEADAEVQTMLALASLATESNLASEYLTWLAQCAFKAGSLDRGEKWAGQALTMGGSAEVVCDALRLLGHVQIEQGRFREAETTFTAMRRHAEVPSQRAAAAYGLLRSRFDRWTVEAEEVERPALFELARDSLDLAERAGSEDPSALSKILWILGALSSQESASEALFRRCETVAPSDEDRSYCLNGLVRLLMRSRPDEARVIALDSLELARRSKQPVRLVYAWREVLRAASDHRAAQDALAQIEALREQQTGAEFRAEFFSTWSDDYLWLSGKILDSAHPDLLPTAFQVTERMRARSLLDQLSNSSATPDDFATLDAVRASLAPDQAMLSYQIAPWVDWAKDFGGGSWLLAITRDGVRVLRLDRDRTFWRGAVPTLVGLITARDGREEESAVELYRDLLGPALAELPEGIRRLVLVPDDVLHKLPFELLRERVGAPPVGERFEVSRVPSATLWRRWQEAPAEVADVPGWILADPSPLPPGPGGQALRALPCARQEGRDIAQALGGGSRLALGAQASEAAFVGQPPRLAAVLHFGTHAVVDEDDAARSAIFLGAGAGEDGRLEPDEIVELPVAGRLVVLSSCESAAGIVLRGEGVLSLARAFFQGKRTRAVVASLWPLRDDDARAFFIRFYRHLGRGETVAAAGRAVRTELRAAGFPAEAWAGVVVLGDGELAPIARPVAKPSGLFAGLAAALGLGAALWNRRKART